MHKKTNKKSRKKLVIEAVFAESAEGDEALFQNLFEYLDCEGIIKPE